MSAIANAQRYAADRQFEIAKEQLDWAREQYASDKAMIEPIARTSAQIMEENLKNAQKDRARYESEFQPLEDRLIAEAEDFASPGRIDREVGRAQSQVAQQFEGARIAAQQQLESYGIDPSAVRYAALDLGTRTQEAAAKAAAGMNATMMTEAQGRALRSEAINVGRGYPGQIASSYGTSLQGGNNATNQTLAPTAMGAQIMGTPMQWEGLGNQSLTGWANTVNMGYRNQLDAWKASQSNNSGSSGLGSLLGAGLSLISKFEDGGMVPAAIPMDGAPPPPAPAPTAAPSTGGPVPVQASPTRGAAIDDVPARLTPGEFVLPRDVVSWYGEEKLQKMVEGARKKRQGVTAKPTRGPAAPMPPTFASRPQAIPMG